ncbi:THUMP domain-containing protein 1 [Lingula anatina]|uniref:THUMP domain-containing protein 1 n=1 Tax=Lingula anatina TaxID=7574 RepID=A0A1S3HIZ0_LINAN|nr:THUMP domain-containing protein 1 [Lingula anatina]|eukprot:XP_013386078.1 THUMP domain-containing protein 1 [Lingula anatina]
MGKRPKSYYIKCAMKKRKREFSLDAGMKGFLLTCNNNEKQCVREAYNILNEYADKLYGPEKAGSGERDGSDDGEAEEEEEDISKVLEKELHTLKETDSSQRRFQVVESGAKNVIFIRTTLEDPCHLVHAILSDLQETKQQKARYIMRMLPIATTCKAVLEKVLESVESAFDAELGPSTAGQSFYIMAKIRNNNSFSTAGISKEIAGTIITMNSKNSVDYQNPDIVVLVEILKGNCCMSIVRDYFKFKKYNLHEVAKTVTTEPKEGDYQSQDDQGEAKELDTGEETKIEETKTESIKDVSQTPVVAKLTENQKDSSQQVLPELDSSTPTTSASQSTAVVEVQDSRVEDSEDVPSGSGTGTGS